MENKVVEKAVKFGDEYFGIDDNVVINTYDNETYEGTILMINKRVTDEMEDWCLSIIVPHTTRECRIITLLFGEIELIEKIKEPMDKASNSNYKAMVDEFYQNH